VSKKVKKAKTPKAPKGRGGSGRGKDAVTGLFSNVNGQRIGTDVTYSDISSSEGKAFYESLNDMPEERVFSEGGSSMFEIELGKTAVIFTRQVVGEILVDGRRQHSKNYRQRVAWLGDFTYDKNGAFQKASLREVAEWTYGEQWSNGEIFEWGSVDRGNASGLTSLMTLFNPSLLMPGRVYDYASIYSDSGNTQGDPRSAFYNFESSKYFENGWWDNPFSTNLI